ncbi:MAG: twitch domain-containing radical SAM protein [Hyphomicrobiales bacterium]
MTESVAISERRRKSFCVMPFLNAHVTTDGSIAPCCEYSGSLGNVRDMTLLDAWKGQALRDIRARFAEGEEVPGCWKCFEREAAGGTSMRTQTNKAFEPWRERLLEADDPSAVAPAAPVRLDVRFSNICNFRCRTCWHGASSKWFKDGVAIGVTAGPTAEIRSFAGVPALLAQLGESIDCLQSVYFAGGEPLLMQEHYSFLDLLIGRGRTDVELSYNSNMSALSLGGQSVLDRWPKFASVKVAASIDASGERGAYIRKEFDWDRFVRNIAIVRERCSHVELSFGITVSVLNVLTLNDLIAHLMAKCAADPASIYLNSLQDPPFYRTQVLPPWMKRKATRRLRRLRKDLLEVGRHDPDRENLAALGVAEVVQFMNACQRDDQSAALKENLVRLDSLRGESYQRTLPELDGIWSNWRANAEKLRTLIGLSNRRQVHRGGAG